MCGLEELCCRTPWRSHVLQGARFLFLHTLSPFSLIQSDQGDEITVLMQLADDDGVFLVRFSPSKSVLPSKPHDHSTLDRAIAKVSSAALPPLLFSSLESSKHPSSQSALPPRPNHPVRAL